MDGRRTVTAALAAGLLLAATTTTGCFAFRRERMEWADDVEARTGEGREGVDSRETSGPVFPVGSATVLDARLMMGAGELRISSAETGTIETGFRYSGDQPAPRSRYDVDDDEVGRLRVTQHDPARFDWRGFDRGTEYSWDIGLPPGLPTDLKLEMGAGEADIDLSGVDIRRLEVLLGAGETTIDLGGPRVSDLEADIQAGVGRLVVKVPSDVGVRVFGRQDGVGSFSAEGMRADGNAYVNDAYGRAPVTLDISLQRGIGEVIIEQAE